MVRTPGTTFQLVGVSGTTVDPLPVIAYHDQAVSKAMLAMFLDLGHDTGARSLGDTFVDFFTASLQAVADQIAETATEHIIRDLVEENFGPDEPYPVLTPGNLSEQQAVSITTLAALSNAKLIIPDGKLEEHIRTRFGLPEVDEASRPQPILPMIAPGTPGKPGTPPQLSPVKKTEASEDPDLSDDDLVGYARKLVKQIEAGHLGAHY
jgi:hypothetical protein